MKKLLLFFVFISLFFKTLNSYAQLTMTHGDAYNYTVGDVFVIHSYSKNVSGPGGYSYSPTDSLYEKTTILNKFFSASADTVFYNCLIKTKYVHYNQPYAQAPYFTFTYNTLTDTLFYTDLNSPIQNYPFMMTYPCYADSIDSVYIEPNPYCSKKIWHKEYVWGTNCFEEPFQKYDYVEGCGGPYYYYFDASGGSLNWRDLIYYKKGIDSCGQNVSFTTGLAELSNLESEITVFPNPMNTYTTITFSEPQKQATIILTDALGKEIKKINFTGKQLRIEKEEMKAGIYFIRIIDEKKSAVNKKIVIQ
ncbi:MAG: hypothetical protein A3F72_01395 [Bacteroidetes bacterium RIFCSPLOWO2_12_FULL_35_15]|nr:MAG: hypothetical protein A3F72_01395 [Bacteroidetes bacterium RIFCSPLOWO2_12_FULL_35_15]